MKNNEFIDEFIKKVGFFNKKAIFLPITDSNSGAMVWKVNDNGRDYLLKVITNGNFSLNNFIEITKMYKVNNVNSINLVSYGIFQNECYIIYDFINGKPLNNLYNIVSANSFLDFGINVGTEYFLINKSCFDKIPVRNYDIAILTDELTSQFLDVYNNKLNYLQEIFSLKNIDILVKKMKFLMRTFINEKKVIIHSDMHPKNIILSEDKELFIIDIDATSYDYFAMNFRYSLMAAFKNDENKNFFKGFIRGFYHGNIPVIFYQQLLYVLILNFMEHIILFSNNKEKKDIYEYGNMVKRVFDNISIFDDDVYSDDKLVDIFS